MRALEALADIRRQGFRPAVVWVLFGDGATQRPFWKEPDAPVELVVAPRDPFLRYDWRVLLDCDVIVLAAERSDALETLVKCLTRYAAILTLYLTALLPERLGFVWTKGRGWREFGGAHG